MQIVKRPLHVRIDGRWYDVTGWADKHPGGRYVLEWADGFDITGAFHTIHLFGGKTASSVLKALPEVAETSLTAGESVPPILPKVDRVPMEAQAPTPPAILERSRGRRCPLLVFLGSSRWPPSPSPA